MPLALLGKKPSKKRGSNQASTLAGRIKRDRPDIAAAVERGEYGSMRAASKAAGIVRKRIQIDAEDYERAAKIIRKRLSSPPARLRYPGG